MAHEPDHVIEAQVLDAPPDPAITMTQPVFVLGILQRSGTNHLWDLLRLHPDLEIRMPIVEDHILQRAHLLKDYVDSVTAGWRSPMLPAFEPEFLLRSLGDGIVSYFQSPTPDRRVVTKCPSVDNLELFTGLFPDAQAVIIVRDGRSLVESGVKSFGWTYESLMQRWAEAAGAIRDFDRAHAGEGQRHRIVRFEDLISDMPGTIEATLTFLGLDPSRYDYDAAGQLPVRGSSTLKTDSKASEVHWKPQTRPEGFDPRRRFDHWDPYKRERFEALGGELQAYFGYDREPVEPNLARRIHQVVDDVGWVARVQRRRARATWDFVRSLGGPSSGRY